MNAVQGSREYMSSSRLPVLGRAKTTDFWRYPCYEESTMYVTFETPNGKPYAIDVWFNVFRVDEGGKEVIGTFEKISDAIDFERNEEGLTIIEVEHNG